MFFLNSIYCFLVTTSYTVIIKISKTKITKEIKATCKHLVPHEDN